MAAASPPPFFSPSSPNKKSRHFERSEASENGEALDEVKSFVPMLRDNFNYTLFEKKLNFEKKKYLCCFKFLKLKS